MRAAAAREKGAPQSEGVAKVLEKVGVIRVVLEDRRILDHEPFEEVICGAGLVMGQRLENSILNGTGISRPLIDPTQPFHDGSYRDRVIDVAKFIDQFCLGLEIILSIVGQGIDRLQVNRARPRAQNIHLEPHPAHAGR